MSVLNLTDLFPPKKHENLIVKTSFWIYLPKIVGQQIYYKTRYVFFIYSDVISTFKYSTTHWWLMCSRWLFPATISMMSFVYDQVNISSKLNSGETSIMHGQPGWYLIAESGFIWLTKAQRRTIAQPMTH